MTTTVLCTLAAAVGLAAGFALSRRISCQQLLLARHSGQMSGRREQADRVAFLERRVIHLEACLRRFTIGNGVRP